MQRPQQPHLDRAAPGHRETREMLGSLIAEPTAFIDLSADFIAKLRKIAPQPTRPRLRYAVAMIALMALAFLAVTSAHRTVLAMHPPKTAPSAPPSAAAPPATPAAPTPALVSAPVPETTATPSPANDTIELSDNDVAPAASVADAKSDEPKAASGKKHSHTPRKPHRRTHR